jgi:diguanylate cyclase (GGDEF)-like protein/PAS domain S-box-containing protein
VATGGRKLAGSRGVVERARERWSATVSGRARREEAPAHEGSLPVWRSRAWLGGWALLAALYFGAAKGGLALAYEHDQVTAVWPPSGIALAAAFLWGYRVWPGLMLGAFVANVWTGAPLLSDLGIAAGNTAEGLVGAALLRRSGFRPSLARVRDVVSLAVLAAGLSTMVSATVGTASLWLGDVISSGHLLSVWRAWWLGDAGGDLLVAPFLMLAATRAPVTQLRRGRVVEAACLVVVLVGSSVVAFSSPGRVFAVFPGLIWAALRFRQSGATAGSLVVAGLAVWFTAHRMGPFVTDSPDDSLLLSQSFVGVVHMTVLVLAAVTTVRDQGEHALRQGEARKTAIVDSALDCVITTDDQGRVIEFNPAAERTFGYTLGEVRGRDVAAVILPPRLRGRYRSAIARYRITGKSRMLDKRLEMTAMRRDGSEFPVELYVTRIALDGPAMFTAYLRDITDRKRADVQLHFLAEHDPLTGLVNRRRFEDELQRQVGYAERYSFGGALIMMDIDNFKQINDTLGHSAGDAVIKNVAGLLERRLRKGDTVGRLGGDEFAVLLPRASEQEAHAVVEDLLSALHNQVVPFGGHDIRVTASMGMAPVTGDAGPEQLLVRADLAMYKAKELGGKGAWPPVV